MSIRSAALGLAMLTAMAASAFAEDQPAPPTEAAEPHWVEFQSPERGFAVTFPGTPKFASAPVEGQNPLLQYDFQVSLGEETVYSVVVFEYPQGKGPSPDNDTYVKLVNAYAKGSETRLRKRGAATDCRLFGLRSDLRRSQGQAQSLDRRRAVGRPHLHVGHGGSQGPRNGRRRNALPRFLPLARAGRA